jgi:hypothetical protein
MKLTLLRFSDDGDSTLGCIYINGIPECFILEDQWQKEKVKHETRIPAGTYKITLRTVGSFHERYSKHKDARVRAMHKGMLWLRDVPGFEYILIHCGNNDDHTSGCLLTGRTAYFNRYNEGEVLQSIEAYIKLYPQVADALEAGEEVHIEIIDMDRKITA